MLSSLKAKMLASFFISDSARHLEEQTCNATAVNGNNLAGNIPDLSNLNYGNSYLLILLTQEHSWF